MTARGKAVEEVADRLCEGIRRLARAGVEALPFARLVGALKAAVRQRWMAVWGYSEGETGFEDRDEELAPLVPLVRPETRFEELDSFQKLISCISELLDKSREKAKTREYLHRLWLFLRGYAAECPASEEEESETSFPSPDMLPSRRKMADLLGIPRERLPGLHATLGTLLTECRVSSLAGRSSVGVIMDSKQRRQQLGQRLAKALASQEAGMRDRQGGGSRVGELYAFEGTGDLPVQWVVIEQDSTNEGHWLLIAADSNPLVGSADVAVSGAAATGALSFRCRCVLRLDERGLERGRRTGSIDRATVEQIQRERDLLAANVEVGSSLEKEVDFEPEYQDWMAELDAMRQELRKRLRSTQVAASRAPLFASSSKGRQRPRFSARERGWERPLALAASLLLALSVGFGGGVFWHSRKAEGPSGPVVDAPWHIFPRAAPVRGDAEEVAEGAFWLFNLEIAESRYPAYRLEVSTLAGRLIWGDVLTKTGPFELSVRMTSASLPAGKYQLHLFGVSGDGSELLRGYPRTIEVD